MICARSKPLITSILSGLVRLFVLGVCLGISSFKVGAQLMEEDSFSSFEPDTSNPYLSEKEAEEKELQERINFLQTNRVEDVYVELGFVTCLRFEGKHPIESVRVGAPLVAVTLDQNRPNTLYINPTVSEGQTNMFVTINGVPYSFIVHIIADDRVMYRKTYTMPDSIAVQSKNNVPRVSGPALQPQDIDVVFYINAVEQSRRDPTYYRAMKQTMQVVSLDKIYTWNGCGVHLIEAVQFPKQNLVILKVQWQNLTDRALYLSADQYKVYVGNRFIPVTTKSQLSELLFPGQMDTVYLFLQGYGLTADNAYELALPPEAEGVRKLLEGY